MTKPFRFASFFLILIISCLSCKKTDFHEILRTQHENSQLILNKEIFFRHSDTLDKTLVGIIEDIKRQDSILNFTGALSKKEWLSNLGGSNRQL